MYKLCQKELLLSESPLWSDIPCQTPVVDLGTVFTLTDALTTATLNITQRRIQCFDLNQGTSLFSLNFETASPPSYSNPTTIISVHTTNENGLTQQET